MKKKLPLIVFMIACNLSLTACLTSQPAAPKYAYCPLIAAVGDRPAYLYCTMPDGSKQRIPIAGLRSRPEKYICTTDESYADGINYQRAMSRWIDNNCH